MSVKSLRVIMYSAEYRSCEFQQRIESRTYSPYEDIQNEIIFIKLHELLGLVHEKG